VTRPTEPVRYLPDVLHLVYAFLAAQPDLTALVADRIYTVLPNERRYPLLWLSQVGSSPLTSRPWWGERTDLQLAAYGTTDRVARKVCECARSLCVCALIGDHAEGVVSWVDTLNLNALPDDALVASTGRAIPRWITTVTVTAHPLPVPAT
jgi:Protein of unknown function (DUF3168)